MGAVVVEYWGVLAVSGYSSLVFAVRCGWWLLVAVGNVVVRCVLQLLGAVGVCCFLLCAVPYFSLLRFLFVACGCW